MRLIKRAICLTISIVFVFFSLFCCDIFCVHPGIENEDCFNSFYREKENSLDAVFLGASATQMDIYPNVIWENYKITSYNFSFQACPSSMYKSMLKEILSKQKNIVLVVDLDGFFLSEEEQFDNRINSWIDSMPRNRNWFDTINENISGSKRWNSYFPLIRYHRNITSVYQMYINTSVLEYKKIHKIKSYTFGGKINWHIPDKTVSLFSYSTKEKTKLPDSVNDILFDFLSFCKEADLRDVVFIDYPRGYSNQIQFNSNLEKLKEINYIKDVVKKYDYKTISIYSEQNNPANINCSSDFGDHMHLRPSGSISYSKYIGSILNNMYQFKNKDSEIIEDWNKRSQKADKMIAKRLKDAEGQTSNSYYQENFKDLI